MVVNQETLMLCRQPSPVAEHPSGTYRGVSVLLTVARNREASVAHGT